MQLNVSPCSFWEALHDMEPCMALVYNEQSANKLQFSEFVNEMLSEKKHVLKAFCKHFDDKLSTNPILLFEPKQSLKDYCTSCAIGLSEVDQLTVLQDVAIGTLGFLSPPNSKLTVVTIDSIFIHEDGDGKIRALFSPLYQSSYFPQIELTSESLLNYEWIKEVLLFINYQDQYGEHSELPESHILYNIFKYKWFSDEENHHPNDIYEVAKEIMYILGK